MRSVPGPVNRDAARPAPPPTLTSARALHSLGVMPRRKRARTDAPASAGDRRIRDIVSECRSKNIQVVRFLYCDNGSVIRGKACHTRFLESYLRSGIGLTVAMQSMNMLDQLVPE